MSHLLQKGLRTLYSKPQSPLYSLAVHGLATWRISHILVYEAGPWAVFTRLRESLGIVHNDAGVPVGWPDGVVLACALCTSVWVGFGLLLVPQVVKEGFAASAISCILEAHNG